MSMERTRRKEGDSHFYTAEGKKYFIVGEPLTADKLPMPSVAQIRDAVQPIDKRWKPSWVRRFTLNPITFTLLIMFIVACFGYVGYQLIF